MGLTGILIGWLCLLLLLARLAGVAPRVEARWLRRAFPLLALALLAASLPTLRSLWAYTADDAYIIARYAANVVEHGEPVFNRGERVNAITTPLTMGVMAILYAVAPERLMELYKALCLALHLGALALVAVRLRSAVGTCVFVVLVALSPYFNLWIAGGLETMLLAVLLLLIAVLVTGPAGGTAALSSPRTGAAVALLASLAFATRYDSVLFTLPVLLLVVVRQRRRRDAIGVAALAATLHAALLLANHLYYGDPLPTSFYLKARGGLAVEGWVYVLEFLIYSGIFVLALFVITNDRRRGDESGGGRALDPRAALWSGLFLVCVPYATSTATAHMMYGFRAFMPYLAVIAFLLARRVADDLAAASRAETPSAAAGFLESLSLVVVVVALIQFSSASIMPRTSLGGARVGEFRAHWDIPAYLGAIQASAGVVERDWAERQAAEPLRVYSPNEGIASYLLRDAYFYGRLTGYRRLCPVRLPEYARGSHYAIVEEPFLELHMRGIELAEWKLLHRSRTFSRGHHAGQRSHVRVYRNPHPESLDVASRVGDPCPDGTARRGGR